MPGIWLDPPGKAWTAPVTVSCLLARLAAVDVLQVDGSVCVEASCLSARLAAVDVLQVD